MLDGRGGAPGAWDRALAAALLATIATAALAYAPAVPYPGALQRHAAALVGGIACATVAARALAGHGFPLTPLPFASLSIAGSLAFTAAIPLDYSFVYSRSAAVSVAAAAIGLCLLASGARAVARGGLDGRLLTGVAVLCTAVAAVVLLEAAGLDPLGASAYYDSRANPVATFGNTNPLVNFLTPAGSVAFALAIAAEGRARVAFSIAALVVALAVGVAGVHYGVIAWSAGIGTAIVLTARLRRRQRRGPPSAACLALTSAVLAAAWVPWAVKGWTAEPGGPAPPAAGTGRWPVPATLEVRARVWLASARLALDFAPWGTGAGGFAISFPMERDPREIELSTHFRRDTAESVVDHAHNDPVQLVVEGGVLALAALGALAVGFGRWRKQGVYTADPGAVAATSGLTATLVTALAHAPLYDTAASATLTAVLFGVLGARDAAEGWTGRAEIPAVAARPLAVVVLCALPLPMLVAARALESDLLLTRERLEPSVAFERLRRAAELAPDDVHPVLELGRRLRASGDAAGALAAFTEAKRRHPYLFEPVLNCGVLLAEQGNFEAALEAFAICEDIDPTHPALRTNRRQLYLDAAARARDARKDRDAVDLLCQAIQLGAPEVLLREWGSSLYELKEYARCVVYLDRFASRCPLDSNNWHRMGMAFQKLGNLDAAALDFARAHHLFALEHLGAGNDEAAGRSAKQFRRWAEPSDAGPAVLDALLALRGGDRSSATQSLRHAREESQRLDPTILAHESYAPLREDPELGAAVRALLP